MYFDILYYLLTLGAWLLNLSLHAVREFVDLRSSLSQTQIRRSQGQSAFSVPLEALSSQIQFDKLETLMLGACGAPVRTLDVAFFLVDVCPLGVQVQWDDDIFDEDARPRVEGWSELHGTFQRAVCMRVVVWAARPVQDATVR